MELIRGGLEEASVRVEACLHQFRHELPEQPSPIHPSLLQSRRIDQTNFHSLLEVWLCVFYCVLCVGVVVWWQCAVCWCCCLVVVCCVRWYVVWVVCYTNTNKNTNMHPKIQIQTHTRTILVREFLKSVFIQKVPAHHDEDHGGVHRFLHLPAS